MSSSSTTYNTSSNSTLSMPSGLSEKILMTHDPRQTHEIELQHLVKLIESIFQNAAAAAAATASASASASASVSASASNGTDDDFTSSLETLEGMRQALDDIRSISCEISCNLSSRNVDEITMKMLQRLKNYSWHAKVVLAMAAFASSIGELSMVVNRRKTDTIAKSVNILKGHSSKLDFTELQKLGLFKAMMDVVNTNLGFSRLTTSMEDATDCFSSATYKILRMVLQIGSSLSSKTEDNFESIRSARKILVDVNEILQEKLEFYKKEAARKAPEQYDVTGRISEISISTVISKIKNYMKIEAPEKVIKRHVLFLISDLEISIEEIKVLNLLYNEQMDQKNDEQKYEIVWLPILDLSTYDTTRFGELKQMMKWIVVEPSRIEPDVIEFIKKKWHFIKKTIAVSVSADDEVTCQNALPMLWTWGNSAFAFTDEKEQILWSKVDEQNGWTLDLLLDEHIISKKHLGIENQEFVCLFGGGDISWIKDFTEKVKCTAYAAGVSLKMVYVGKSKGKGISRNELGRDINVIESEFQWQFWSRLESILNAKIRLGKTVTAYKTDRVMQEALKVVGYGGKGEAWAMFSMGSDAMVTTNGEMAVTIMSNYNNWGQEKTGIYFLKGLKKYKEVMSRDVHGCINVHLPVLGQIPGIIMCPECSKVMEMFYTYRCCDE